jgi:hypothetical protein
VLNSRGVSTGEAGDTRRSKLFLQPQFVDLVVEDFDFPSRMGIPRIPQKLDKQPLPFGD